MMFFAISDTSQVMISQNFGARKAERIRAFLKTASVIIALVSVILIALLTSSSEMLINLFVDEDNSIGTVAMANEFVTYVWPLFLFAGFNMLISGYLTAIHLPFESGLVALCRSLLFPAGFGVLLYYLLSDFRFVIALSIAEGLTFVLALVVFLRHRPARLFPVP
jgi:Na+-driven multidrug efflux pump